MDTSSPPLSHFPSLPPFPSSVPTAPLLRLSLQKLLDNDPAESTRLWESCRDVGFFYLDLRGAKGIADGSDGVERDVDGDSLLRDADALFGVAEEFFGLPLQEKVSYDFKSQGSYFGYKGYGEGVVDKDGRKDRNEFYNISKDDILKFSDPLPQPSLFSPRHPLISSYIKTSNSIVNIVLTHLNKSLHLPPNTLSRIHRLSARSGDQVRFVRAPPQPPSDQQDAIGAHTDFGSVTLLFNRLGGLKILPPSSDGNPEDRYDESKWLWVQPLRGHCVVNLGDAMVKFTRGVLRSNIHKVVNPPGEQASGVRYSLVYFARPEDDVVLKPLSGSDIIDARKGEVPDEQEEISSKEWILRRALGRRGVGEWSKSEGTESVRVNLDFDARLPIPFSVFPSTYRSDTSVTEETNIKVEGQASLPLRGGREGIVDSRYSYSATGPGRETFRQETRVYEEDQFRRPGRREEDIHIDVQERREHRGRETRENVKVDFEERRDYRGRNQRENINVDIDVEQSRYSKPYRRYASAQLGADEQVYDRDFRPVNVSSRPRDTKVEVDISDREFRRPYRASVTESFVEKEQVTTKGEYPKHKRDMGYYDEDGHYHSFRRGLHRAADRVLHPFRDNVKEEIDININMSGGNQGYSGGQGYSSGGGSSSSRQGSPPNTITIPCHHIRIGDLLILQGRPCQVIKISVSHQTGQHRYLGVDLFGKQLYEETSFASNPGPNVYVQNMLGPVFKQYRILDITSDGQLVAMTDSGDIKQGLPILDQGGLFDRLSEAFGNGRGSVRVLVISDAGNELAVDMKVMRGANL